MSEAQGRTKAETVTWTVSGDDMVTNRYSLSGDTMTPQSEPPSEDETELWGMVERRALTDPVLHMMVTHVHRGDCGKVEALARVVLFLSTERARWMAEEVARLNNSVGMGRF